MSPKGAEQPVTLHRARPPGSFFLTSTSTWRNSSWKRGISDTRVRTTGMVRIRWNCLVFPQAVSLFIPREIFARPHFDCTPSGSSFLILEIRHLNFSGNPPSLLPLPFGASVAVFLLRGGPSLTRYITEPNKISILAIASSLPKCFTSTRYDLLIESKHSYPGFQKRIAKSSLGDRTWEIRCSVCFSLEDSMRQIQLDNLVNLASWKYLEMKIYISIYICWEKIFRKNLRW